MKIFLMRHADALLLKPDQEDYERSLSPKGKKQSKEKAQELKARKISFDAIFTSPYLRANQTADIIAKTLGIEAKISPEPLLLPGCDFGDLMEIIDYYPDYENVLVVGHEPDLSSIAAQFLDLEEPKPLKTAEIVEIEI